VSNKATSLRLCLRGEIGDIPRFRQLGQHKCLETRNVPNVRLEGEMVGALHALESPRELDIDAALDFAAAFGCAELWMMAIEKILSHDRNFQVL